MVERMFEGMEQMGDRSENWTEILVEIGQRLTNWSRVDPRTLPTDELLNRFRQSLRDEAIISQFRREFIGELAEIQVGDWLDSAPDLPDWFAVRSAEICHWRLVGLGSWS
jgi:hypothetical protein